MEFAFPFRRFQIAEVFRNETSKLAGVGISFQGDFDQIFLGKVPPQANSEILQIICDTMLDLKFKKEQYKINIFNRKIIDGFLNDLKIKDENQKFKVLRAIDKFDRIDENFIDLLQKERIDPVLVTKYQC